MVSNLAEFGRRDSRLLKVLSGEVRGLSGLLESTAADTSVSLFYAGPRTYFVLEAKQNQACLTN